MISVMIVEDEPPILRSIRDSISSANPNFKITSLAYNGQQAIDILKEDCPDVIFTDIRMPGIDGIGLLTYIKEKNLDIISVVLSGYKDFEYAKKAISLGVNEYLLKPVAMNELNNLINRIEEKINCKKDFAERSYLYNTLNNNASSQKNNKVKLKYKSYLLMLVCAGSYQIATSDYVAACSDYWKSEDRECVVKRSLNFDGKVWFFDGNSSVEKIILFALNENSDKIVNRISQNVFSELAVSSIPITIVISSLFKTVTDMSHMSRLLRITLRKKIVVGLSQIIKQYDMEYNIQNNQKEIPLLDSYTENKLVFSMKNSNTQEFKTDLKRLFQVWEESKYPQIWVEKLLKYIITLCQRVLPHYSQKDFLNLELQVDEAISNSYGYEVLFNNIWYTFEEIFAENNIKNRDEDIIIFIQQLEEYLKINYTEPITSQTLCEKFGYVPTYLSKLFKKYKNVSPTEYLIDLRVEKAKELLRSKPDMLSKDIAYLLGFSDSHYFSKVFKNKTGMRPSDFRDS